MADTTDLKSVAARRGFDSLLEYQFMIYSLKTYTSDSNNVYYIHQIRDDLTHYQCVASNDTHGWNKGWVDIRPSRMTKSTFVHKFLVDPANRKVGSYYITPDGDTKFTIITESEVFLEVL